MYFVIVKKVVWLNSCNGIIGVDLRVPTSSWARLHGCLLLISLSQVVLSFASRLTHASVIHHWNGCVNSVEMFSDIQWIKHDFFLLSVLSCHCLRSAGHHLRNGIWQVSYFWLLRNLLACIVNVCECCSDGIAMAWCSAGMAQHHCWNACTSCVVQGIGALDSQDSLCQCLPPHSVVKCVEHR